MKMYKVLIVDDEPIVREGLEYIIEWEEFGFQVIETAENGKKGLEKIHSFNPDLVITDIRMPGMDGIEMVREARKENLPAKFIVLSGYSDFNYAKEAMSLGMLYYLLKPIEEEELIKALKKIKQQLHEEKKRQKTLKQYKEYEMTAKIKGFLLNQKEFERMGEVLDYHSFRLISCFSNLPQVQRNELEDQMQHFTDVPLYVFTHGTTIYLLVCDANDEQFQRIVDELMNCLRGAKGDRWVALSRKVYSLQQTKFLYQEILELQEKRYLFPEMDVLSSKILEKQLKDNSQAGDGSQTLRERLSEAIKKSNGEDITEVLNLYTDFYRTSGWPVEKIKADLSNLVLYCIEFLERVMEKPVKEQEKNKIISVILSEKSFLKTIEFLKEVFIDFGRFFYESNEKQDIVEEIVRYTKKNYHKELTLTNLAKRFNYSHSYLGKKFRTEMEMGYNTFLDQIRVNQAKRLLENHSLFVYEIAEKVGYSNADYFHKKFKKVTGLSPKQYRINYTEAGK